MIVQIPPTWGKKNPYVKCFGMFCLSVLIAILTHVFHAVEGTMKIHYIYATNKHVLTQLMVKLLLGFCGFCIDGKWV